MLLSSCALFKRNRVLENKEIEKAAYGFNTFFYPSKTAESKTLVIFLSGDGGWLDFDASLCKLFAANGLETVGINSRSYFWKERSPKETGRQFRLLLRSYLRKTNIRRVYLVGYSFGADVTPFLYTDLPYFLKPHVKKLILLSPFATTDFEVHFSNLLGGTADNYKYSVTNEITKIKIPIYCFYGEGEEKPLKNLQQQNFKISLLKGNHHYEEQENQKILEALLNQTEQ